MTTFALLEYFVRSRDRAYRLLAAEQARSDRLLLSIFPRAIAERLKVAHGVIAERSDEVSVLFADIAGFTPAAERLPAEEVVVLLDEIFSMFDELVARHGLEKIKTIGDGYLVAAGIPTPRDDHAQATARLALAMRARSPSCRRPPASAFASGSTRGRSSRASSAGASSATTSGETPSTPPAACSLTRRPGRSRSPSGRTPVWPRASPSSGAPRVTVKGKGEMTTYLLLGERMDRSAQAASSR